MLNNILVSILLTNAVINVNVKNRTDSSIIVSGGKVHLLGFDSMGQIIFNDSTDLRKGKAKFNIPDTTLFFTATYKYHDVVFTSSLDSFPSTTLDIDVFEPIDNLDALQFQRFHLILTQSSTDTLTVTGIASFNLDTNRVYPGGPSLAFPIPHSASQSFVPLVPRRDDRWMVIRDTIFYLGAIYPGTQTIAYGYNLPVKRAPLEIHKSFPFTVPVVDVFVQPSVKVLKTDLANIGERKLGGTSFIYYHGGNLKEFSLSVVPSVSGGTLNRQWVLVGGVVVLVLLIAFYIQRARKPQEPEEEEDYYEDESDDEEEYDEKEEPGQE